MTKRELSPEEIAIAKVVEELSKEDYNPLDIPRILDDESLDEDYLRELLENESVDIVEKYHEAVVRVEKFSKFIQDCENEGI